MVTAVREEVVNYTPLGGCLELFRCHEPEILIEGAAGTGKTFACCHLVHLLCSRYPGLRVLMCRKTGVALTSTALVTYGKKVLHPSEGVRFFGGSKSEPAAYRYPNGSVIVVGGLDNPDKILSSEYDLIYVNEATELTEADWETLTTRLGRNKVYQYPRIIGDCNPTYGKHWLNRRCNEGRTHRITTSHADNPSLSAEYIATLDRLSGSLFERLRLGLWVGVENAAYPQFDREIHIRPLESGLVFRRGMIGVDYGRVHKSASAVAQMDQYGRVWIREVWSEADTEHGKMTIAAVGRHRRDYSINAVVCDPNQDVLLGDVMTTTGSLAEGPRQTRINLTSMLFNVWPGGQVPWPLKLQLSDTTTYMTPTTRPDTPGLLLVKGGAGIDELADEIESYHYVHRVTETKEDDVIARLDDNRIAAVEYANWGLQNMPFREPGELFGQVRRG